MIPLKFRPTLLAIAGLSGFLIACTPPTPPPSPTPWPDNIASPAALTAEAQSPSPVTPTPTPVSTATSSPRPTFTPPATHIVIWENLPASQAQTLADEVDLFQQQFPHYAVTLNHYDKAEDLLAPPAADEVDFDIALVSPPLLNQLWAAGQLAPMSDFFPASFTNDFAGVTLAGASRDDELWALSDSAGFHLLLFYNRNLIDTPPTDTTELLAVAQELTQDESSWGLAVNSYDPLWVVPWLAPYGGWLTDERGQPTLNTPAMESALTLYLSWQGRLTGIAPVIGYDEARTRFINGDIAMLIDGEWALTELAQNDKIEWGVAPLPGVGEAGENQPAAPLVLARYWAISREATGDRALASAAFLEYITRPERQLEWTVRFGLLPTRLTALDNLIIVNDSALRASTTQMLNGRTIPLGTDAEHLLNAMRGPLRGVIDGALTPQEAAELMQLNVEEK